ncbi:hypothetical protein BS11774_06810 [Bacillus subtilis]|uniref:Transcriptional regulator n=1 Tax=Bacillus subtilis TaxID=1423 RepID=A0A8I1WJV5_BACIU|nr:hypothetical protein [Bacillus subtilis]OTQ84458.1 hypothetical protein BG30_13695 [Bacillus subtilis subsp. subtilis]ASZ59963.1 hypothetical protein CLD04_01330 [Bacillus subtilis]MBO3797118.1 hypothetical protein [Bacillus subtilis]QAR60251.1 hypothetical protein BS11774_06810 [Bacillus subtilis]QGH95074.1 hypothetical protein GII76_01300 [Bacillus subtilis]
MESILKRSLTEKTVLEMIYMRNDGFISKRSIIVRQINQSYIRAYCFTSRQTKTFTIENILAVSPAATKRGVRNYA